MMSSHIYLEEEVDFLEVSELILLRKDYCKINYW